jgi:hypothetical protein
MPVVNPALEMQPQPGYDTLRVQSTTDLPIDNVEGAFRIVCAPSHMRNDDPLVLPGQPGASHHHTFYGNTSTNSNSDLMGFSTTGNSTCNGGIMNRTAYWSPSMVDTKEGRPILPGLAIFYYKAGGNIHAYAPDEVFTVPPKGLRMIAGNPKATSPADTFARYTCLAPEGVNRAFYGWKDSIPDCAVGDSMQVAVTFPQCWNGIDLDSPNHQSHMAYPNWDFSQGSTGRCPKTHPKLIPEIGLNFNFPVTFPHQTTSWRLSSDNYSSAFPGGYSLHSDWVNGWDETFLTGIIKNCLQADKDAHAHLLCDGRMFY